MTFPAWLRPAWATPGVPTLRPVTAACVEALLEVSIGGSHMSSVLHMGGSINGAAPKWLGL